MAKDITIKSEDGQTTLYPKTVSALVYDNKSGKTVEQQIEEQSAGLNDLAQEVHDVVQEINNQHPQTTEKGFFATDPQGNIGMQYTEEGLDFAKISEHAIEILKGAELGGTSNVAQTREAGFFVVDENLNIGMKVDNDGVHAKNILEFEIIND